MNERLVSIFGWDHLINGFDANQMTLNATYNCVSCLCNALITFKFLFFSFTCCIRMIFLSHVFDGLFIVCAILLF